ncbi:AAA family ATPase [Companilactobacillus farciminis]|uniref:AAA family ATPase n=1 Tax=Companilactobacillus farciminis TaxID=1612 RepID=UPI0024204BC9|nr:AAA family ATPase [Companilactobacillus farciminis]
MTRYSYSRVDLWHKCPYHYKARYIDKLIEIPKLDANNPLILGHALHKGLESGEKAMEQDYFDSYPLITNDQVNEMMKLQILLPKVNNILDNFEGCKFQHEYPIMTKDFIGFADLIITAPDGTSTVIDFKYSNHVENYLESGQLHLYKYYLEKLGFNIKHLGYIFIPKTGIKQKQTESLYQFRKRLTEEVSKLKAELVPIKYDDMNVLYFQNTIKGIEAATEYPKNVDHCFSCIDRFEPEYVNAYLYHTWKKTNKRETEIMPIPKNVRREKKQDLKPDTWLYGDSYVGKTTFWDQFDDVLMLNTDGNIDNITSPFDDISDQVKKEGRMIKRTASWEKFLGDIQELELGNPEGYKTIVLDLVEQLYEACRAYVFDKHGWEHESDGTYGKGWTLVTDEFHNAIKRLKAIGLQIVYISKESRDKVTLKGGTVRTTFAPAINAKVANFLSGTVDATLRAYVNDDGTHMIQLTKVTGVFGGGRFNFKVKEVPLEKDSFIEALKDAQPKGAERPELKPEQKLAQEQSETTETPNDEENEKPKRKRRTRKTEEPKDEPVEEPTEEEKPKRKRRSRKSEPVEEMTPPGEDDEPEITEEAPKPRRRRRRTARKED